jgi:hypothetical protein
MTTRTPRYGLSLPNRGVLFGATSVDELLEISERAEASGAFDSIWVGDSLFIKPRPESMESALHLMVNINDDRGAALEESVKFLQTYYSLAMTREYIADWLACGPPTAVIDKIGAYVAAGCTTPILRFASWDQQGQLARALADVMPAALSLSVL